MNVRRLVPVVAMLVLCAAVPALAQVKIAIANPVVIFDKMEERKAKQDEIQDAANRLQKAFNDAKQSIENSRKALDEGGLYKRGTPPYQEELNKIISAAIQLESTAKVQQLELNRKQVETMLVLFKKIQDAIKEEANGKYDMVLTDQRPDLPKLEELGANVDINQIRALILGRTILWAGDNAPDITDKVVARLNDAYKAAGTTRPAGTP